MEKLYDSDSSTEILEQWTQAKNKLEEKRKGYIRVLFSGTKLKWIEDRENPTRYFKVRKKKLSIKL